jgi:hypothetical protein
MDNPSNFDLETGTGDPVSAAFVFLLEQFLTGPNRIAAQVHIDNIKLAAALVKAHPTGAAIAELVKGE